MRVAKRKQIKSQYKHVGKILNLQYLLKKSIKKGSLVFFFLPDLVGMLE